MATLKQRKRKSSLLDFDSFEEYEKFAAKRNEATKRCRQKKDGELKVPMSSDVVSLFRSSPFVTICHLSQETNRSLVVHPICCAKLAGQPMIC